MRILSVRINNLLSIEEAYIEFDDNGLMLVEGWNYDTNRSNGAGKTAIFNCLSFALFEKVPRKITVSELLRRGAKSGYAEVRLVSGSDEWVVKRTRPKGVEFIKNGNKLDISQQEFEAAVRFTYDQFILTMYSPQSGSFLSQRFLTASDSDKKTFILQLLNIDRFSELKKTADDRAKLLASSLQEKNTLLASNQAKISAYSESLPDEEALSTELLETERLLSELTSKMQILSAEVQSFEPELSKYRKLESELRQRMLSLSEARTRRAMLQDRYRELSASLKELDEKGATCSQCGAPLTSEEARTKHLQHLSSLKSKMQAVRQQIEEQDSILQSEAKIGQLAEKLEEKKRRETERYSRASASLAEVKSLLRVQESRKTSLESRLKSSRDLRSKMAALVEANQKLQEDIQSLSYELEIYRTLSMVYSPTGAQAYVLDSVVDSFNEVVQKYIDVLSPDMSYSLNSYRENSKGSTTAKFSETLTKNGTEISVGSLSGGEFRALSLCIDFALLEVLERQFGLSLNPIVLDEPFDGLDVVGREIVLDLLEELSRSRQILVVDHASEAKSSFSKTLFVSLRDGRSTITFR